MRPTAACKMWWRFFLFFPFFLVSEVILERREICVERRAGWSGAMWGGAGRLVLDSSTSGER